MLLVLIFKLNLLFMFFRISPRDPRLLLTYPITWQNTSRILASRIRQKKVVTSSWIHQRKPRQRREPVKSAGKNNRNPLYTTYEALLMNTGIAKTVHSSLFKCEFSWAKVTFSRKWWTLLIDWLIDWLVDWLIDWLVGWLIDWLIDWHTDYTGYLSNNSNCCNLCGH